MDRDQHREMMDRAGRDEAASLQIQQQSAGTEYSPVHARPPHGEPSQTPRTAFGTTGLSHNYVEALDAERVAWQALPGLPGDAAFDQTAWNTWRTAVEERDLATRNLINYALSPRLP